MSPIIYSLILTIILYDFNQFTRLPQETNCLNVHFAHWHLSRDFYLMTDFKLQTLIIKIIFFIHHKTQSQNIISLFQEYEPHGLSLLLSGSLSICRSQLVSIGNTKSIAVYKTMLDYIQQLALSFLADLLLIPTKRVENAITCNNSPNSVGRINSMAHTIMVFFGFIYHSKVKKILRMQ